MRIGLPAAAPGGAVNIPLIRRYHVATHGRNAALELDISRPYFALLRQRTAHKIIYHLAHVNRKTTATDIMRDTGYTYKSIRLFVGRLEAMGLVRRRRRAIIVDNHNLYIFRALMDVSYAVYHRTIRPKGAPPPKR